MKVLVVGGAGYLGGTLIDILTKQKDHDVRVYDFLLYEESYRKDVPFVYGDVRDHEKLQKNFDWADAVVWLAALVGDPACTLNEQLTLSINRDAVQYLRDHFRGRILFMSSCSVYGASDGVLDELSGLQPLSLYAKTKQWAEEILTTHPNALIFRLGTLYGVGDRFTRIRFDLVVNTLVMRAALHNTFSVFGGNQYRPLLHVRDAAAAIAQSLSCKECGLYNLHSENATILTIADRIKKYFPQVTIEVTQSMFQDNRNYRVSSERVKRDLRFTSTHTIDDGIQELKALLIEGRIKDSFIRRFSNYLYLKPLLAEYQSPLGKVIKLYE